VGPEDDWQIQQCRQALAILRERTEKAAFTEAIELETFLRYLSQHFDSTRSPHGFLSGGITFCAMLPMRSIPFEVVVLLGMDEGVFPGPDPVLTFDLMAQHPKPGDRSRRRDDRYLFLEAILSARKKLIITYTGFEAHDGEPRPPSTVVSELIDVLADSFHCPDQDGANLRDRAESYLIVQHPLQPFGVTLFTAETEHRSFDSLFLRGAQALYGPTSTPRAFVDRPLGEEEREPITPDALIRFFKRPLETFLEQRLGVRLRDYSEVQPEREPIIMDSLDQWSLQSLILEGLVAGTRSADMLALLRASGDLPLGDLGNEVFRKGFNQVHPVAERYRSLVGDASRETLAVDLAVGDDTIKGTLSDVHAGGMVSFTASKMKIELKLEGWLKHLVLSCVRSVPQQSLVCARWGKGETKIARFKPLQDPGACLAQLVKLYRAGMQEPLHFFPGPAERYAKKLSQNEPAAGLAAAKRDWFKTAFGQGSSIADSEVVQLLLPNRCPIDEEFQPGGLPSSPDLTFQKIAAVVYLPLFEHLEETS
jgi:exodeoxyribonuclease V gamma subunit